MPGGAPGEIPPNSGGGTLPHSTAMSSHLHTMEPPHLGYTSAGSSTVTTHTHMTTTPAGKSLYKYWALKRGSTTNDLGTEKNSDRKKWKWKYVSLGDDH